MCRLRNRVCSGAIACITIVHCYHALVTGLLQHGIIIIERYGPAVRCLTAPVTCCRRHTICIQQLRRCIGWWCVKWFVPLGSAAAAIVDALVVGVVKVVLDERLAPPARRGGLCLPPRLPRTGGMPALPVPVPASKHACPHGAEARGLEALYGIRST